MGTDLARDLERARAAIAPLVEQQDRQELDSYESLCWRPALAGLPVLNLDDFSAIPFLVDIEGVEEYQHRARLRAGDGDLFAAGTEQNRVYESYCQDRLALGHPEFLFAPSDGDSLTVAAACSSGACFSKLVSRARKAGGMTLHPFMGIQAVWELGRKLAAASGHPVGVLAPPPPVTWIANDKAVFGNVVTRVLSTDYLVETLHGATPDALVLNLTELAGRHRRVALKRLRCASAMGNLVFEADTIAGLDATSLEVKVRTFLERTEWDGHEEVLTVAWEDTDFSPSTQLWIPPGGLGPPRLDGVYEQILEGERRVFVGARPSTLPDRVNDQLGSASLRVAAGLQELGYVGRCSFDFLVVGDVESDCAIHFVECNGRWGGTSTPMALLDRLLAQGQRRHPRPPGRPGPPGQPRPPYRAQDFVHPGLVGAPIEDILAAVGEDLFDPKTGKGRFVFYNVGPLEHFGKLDVIALGVSQDAAEEAVEKDLPRLLGLG